MIPDFSLDKSVWRDFTKTYWNQKPTVIRAPFRNPIVTPAEVFGALVKATRRLRGPTDDLSIHLDTARVLLNTDLDRWLPRAEDASIQRYLARIKCTPKGRQFSIFVRDFQLDLGWVFISRLQQFLKGFYEIEGVPPERAEVDLFFGNYLRTHSGVHRDSADVFCFVVDGRKRFRAWPADTIPSGSPLTGPTRYAHFLKRSVCLEGEPGDIIYWPSSYWHVAESGGWMGSSLSLALHYGTGIAHTFSRGFEAGARQILRGNLIGSLPFSNRRVSHLASIAERVSRESDGLTRGLMRFWMERITGYGFVRIPRVPGRVPWKVDKAVRANPASRILFKRYNKELVISANGRSFVASYSREAVQMMRTLTRGHVCEMADLLRAGRRKRQPVHHATRGTLEFLLEARALEYL